MKTAPATQAQFGQTHWTTVLAAANPDSPGAQEALTTLCRAYWRPLYAFIRRHGHGPHEAQDLTQSFFAHLLERDALRRVNRDQGKFRSFLLGALEYFLLNERDKQRAQRRGGSYEFVSLDELSATEAGGGFDATDAPAPVETFDRHWAWALVRRAMDRLGGDYAASGKRAVFDALQPRLTGETEPGADAAAAARLGMTEGAVKTALSRLRKRFGELLRAEVAETVERPEDVDDEIRHLFRTISR
jgi:RNA polymerase sigma-70 factor (ECF subfamily)